MTDHKSNVAPIGWMQVLPFLSVVTVGIAASFVSMGIINCSLPLKPCSPYKPQYAIVQGAPPIEELAARMTWSASVFVFITAAAMVAAYALSAALESRRDDPAPPRFSPLQYVLFGAALVIALASTLWPGVQPFGPGAPFLAGTRKILPERAVVGVIDVLAIIVILFLVAAACLSLGGSSEALPKDKAEREDEVRRRAGVLARRLARLRLLLVAGATVLVAGVLHVTALYSWAGTLVVEQRAQPQQAPARVSEAVSRADTTQAMAAGESRPNATERAPNVVTHKEMVGAASILAGALYSVILAAIFIPAFAVLSAQSRALADEALAGKPHKEKDDWLTTHGLAGSVPRQLGSLAAVLAPIIVGGPGTVLLKALFQ